MINKVNKMLALLLIVISFIVNSTIVEAKSFDEDIVYSGSGVTDEGISYTIYIDGAIDTYNPNIVASKSFTIIVQFEGNVTPSEYWTTTITDGGITYSGNLRLVSWEYDNLLSSKYTFATYSGILFANI